MFIYVICFVQCYRAHYVTKVFILWSWQRCFLRLCIHTIDTVYTIRIKHVHTVYTIYIKEHYIHIQMYVHTWTGTGSRCTHCVRGLATGLVNPVQLYFQNLQNICFYFLTCIIPCAVGSYTIQIRYRIAKQQNKEPSSSMRTMGKK